MPLPAVLALVFPPAGSTGAEAAPHEVSVALTLSSDELVWDGSGAGTANLAVVDNAIGMCTALNGECAEEDVDWALAKIRKECGSGGWVSIICTEAGVQMVTEIVCFE